MAEEPDRLRDDERAELRALQRRAYGPDADILADPAALQRLRVLETAAAQRRTPGDAAQSHPRTPGASDDIGRDVIVEAAVTLPEVGTAPAGDTPAGEQPAGGAAAASAPRSRRPAVLLLTVGAAVVAVAGALVISTTPAPAENEDLATIRQDAADAASERLSLDDDAPHRNPYELYFDGKRDEVLTLPGAEGVASRVVYDEFLPYGTLYGRLVGAGPTEDDRFCMIVESSPSAVTVCLDPAIWGFAPLPKTLVFPAPQFDAASPGEVAYVGYTLEPDGQVVARPGVDPASASEPEPTRTAVPAPGTQ
ncbi:hypothetical protein [Microbacterium invictum]|uniref:Uncharacterized protein n=1 Tax=Microbacterium invictum TaxID=515415 RepID=A0ABZ0VFE4_9MICO|nr:hypothetical protein [Microbacterium invictum]WQB70890.1 hypothetical protein T9R20_02715 [Microbacterium invictum]